MASDLLGAPGLALALLRRPDMPGPLACVIGDLSLVRALGRRAVPVAVVASSPSSVESFSRFARAIVPTPSFVDAPTQAVDALLAWAKEQPEPPVLFYQGDHDLLAVSRERRRLQPSFRYVIPPEELVEDLVDKVRFAELAERHDLPTPRTRVLLRDDLRNGDVRGWDTFPCVVKPAMRTHWFGSALERAAAQAGQKALRVKDAETLERLLPWLAMHDTDFVIQGAIEGGESLILSYHAYVRESSEVVAEFTGRKHRTSPRRYGVSTYIEITDDPSLKQVGREIVRRLGFHGVLKMDFKQDVRDGRRYLLEINPRFNLWHHPATIAGVSLPELVYRDCIEPGSAKVTGAVRCGTRWMRAREDLRALSEHRRAGELSALGWLRDVIAVDSNEDFMWTDPLPGLVTLAQKADRLRHRLWNWNGLRAAAKAH